MVRQRALGRNVIDLRKNCALQTLFVGSTHPPIRPVGKGIILRDDIFVKW